MNSITRANMGGYIRQQKHSYYFQFSIHMHYTTKKRVVWLLIGAQGRVLNEHDMIAIPAGRHHMMLNQHDNAEANDVIQVPAKPDLCEYLVTSFPEPKQEVKKVAPSIPTPKIPAAVAGWVGLQTVELSRSCSFPPLSLVCSARAPGLRICAEPLGSSARSPWIGSS